MEDKVILEEIIKNKSIRTFFQPIIDVMNSKIIGYEALSRGPKGSPLERPDLLFDAAERYGNLWDLEYLCRSLAIERASKLNIDKYLFLNVDPRIIRDRNFRNGFTRDYLKKFNIDSNMIIFEITERTAIDDYKAFREVLEHYIKQGYKIAIDDTGAGYSGIKLITETKPQFLKLDMGIIRDIDKDSFKQAVCRNFAHLCKLTNMKLIAEGVETKDELVTLINLGIEYVQGYLISRPSETIQDIPSDIKEFIKEQINEKNKNIFYTSKTFPIGKIARFDEPITKDMKCVKVKEMFNNSLCHGLVVVQNKIPIGLVMKNRINMLLSSIYGNALYLNKSVELIMDRNPLIVDYNVPIAEVTHLAMSRQEDKLYDYVIVKRNEEYYGVVSIRRLLECTMDLELTYARHTNPLTGLPGNILIENTLSDVITKGKKVSILYFDINNFKAYNDTYGFENGDRVIKLTSNIITDCLKLHLKDNYFLGHIGGDDYIAIIEEDDFEFINKICTEIAEKFDTHIKGFYTLEDIAKGYVISPNRQGELQKFNLISLCIAGLICDAKKLKTPHMAANILSKIKIECKSSCKLVNKSGIKIEIS
ncbi:GGDEF domain-containing protein [Caloramator australicus]|uniref:EAL domain/GGDEF domain protein n=1 Tax=Caloramator australicus RC3 TaxID=857293 RepID=I7KT28_9CLOT|nr:GGDEF domain-containing protein [Caloramator australicus]CCJ32833.1 EAL domain/GGDEF domain protein [Caloramator australicus RC3]